jgi:hypothetical protein
MATHFYKQLLPSFNGPSVFLDNGLGQELVMNGGTPTVEWSFGIDSLRDHIQALETEMEKSPSSRRTLEALYHTLLAAHSHHEQQHAQVMTEHPTAEDLQEYMASYTLALSKRGNNGSN